VATDGWSKLTGHDVVDLGKKYEDYGVESIIYTDIGRDGMLSGINIEATVRLAQALTIPVIASGGLSNLDDIKALCAVEGEGVDRHHRRSCHLRRFARLQGGAGTRRRVGRLMLAKRIIPCLDVTPAASSRAPISSTCAMPATRSRSPAATTSRAPTRSPSSTSPPRPTSATSSCTSSKPVPSRSSSR
jgi:hypothetical protein